ncbi:MAG: MGMT family protein [bacterium]
MPAASPAATFATRVATVVSSIPAGRVATYGQVAAMAGSPSGARLVARALWAMSEKHGLPWHRVVSSKGVVSLPGEGGRLQRRLLEQEDVEFGPDGRFSLRRFQWRG